jgi:hypothetical protein
MMSVLKGDINEQTQESLQQCTEGEDRFRGSQGAEDDGRDCEHLWGASEPDFQVEASGIRGAATDIFAEGAGERQSAGGADRAAVSADWTTEGRAGLAQKKI